MIPWILIATGLVLQQPAVGPAEPPANPMPVPPTPSPAATPQPAPRTRETAPAAEGMVDLKPVFQAGDTMKIRWTTDTVDVRDGDKLSPQQRRSTSHTELTFTVKIEEVFPDRVYRCSATMNRVIIEAPSPSGFERYDSADPALAGSVFATVAQILVKKPIEFAISGQTLSFYRKEHPRLRTWYSEGVNLLDNTFGDQAFPARFGVLFGWGIDEAKVGQSWKDKLPVRVNSGFAIDTERTFTLLGDDGVTMRIGVKGVGLGAPDAAKRAQTFEKSTYEGTYTVNTASARIRSGEITHLYVMNYTWQGKPASITSTVTEKIERLE